ncbi:PEP-CTERM putative exosortase interaction domain-containing protein [Burkholderiales bacterium JOSHI_001]|nr:PEP-CTERM putative exosortase interaction domain-containing protein [Burkholderiales bacterium JOSHI_001]
MAGYAGAWGCLVFGAALLAVGPAQAQLAPPMSVISVGCGPVGTGWTTTGPLGVGLQDSCDLADSGVGPQGPYSHQAAASVNTGLGGGGAVDANASVTSQGDPLHMWTAGAGGSVQYVVSLAGTGQAPPTTVARVPVRFSAAGMASVSDSDHGHFQITAQVADVNFPFGSFVRNWEGGGSHSDSFSGSTTLQVSTQPGNGFSVLVSATCDVSVWSDRTAECTAAADPLFSFDQAAFDAAMGANSFALDRYYQLQASPGVTLVPEPASAWLALAGGLLLALRRRRATA